MHPRVVLQQLQAQEAFVANSTSETVVVACNYRTLLYLVCTEKNAIKCNEQVGTGGVVMVVWQKRDNQGG